jgi:hypothetical protein
MATHEIHNNLLIYVFVHTNDSFSAARKLLGILSLILMRQAACDMVKTGMEDEFIEAFIVVLG